MTTFRRHSTKVCFVELEGIDAPRKTAVTAMPEPGFLSSASAGAKFHIRGYCFSESPVTFSWHRLLKTTTNSGPSRGPQYRVKRNHHDKFLFRLHLKTLSGTPASTGIGTNRLPSTRKISSRGTAKIPTMAYCIPKMNSQGKNYVSALTHSNSRTP